jgi:hypothetical protein
LGAEKCAHPDINKGVTATEKPCVERIKEFWRECQQVVDIDNEAWPNDLFVATMCSYAYRTIKWLIQGEVQKAKEELWKAEHFLVTSRTAAEVPELVHITVCILDIGHFAWDLAAYSRFGWAIAGEARCFCDILEIAKEIWYEREKFMPHLSDALKAAHGFMFNLEYVTPRRAFRDALKRTSRMYGFADWLAMYGNKPIGHVLPPSAMAKLKEILRAYARTRNEKKDVESKAQL